MSDRELPEIESGKIPLIVLLFVGVVFLFFGWLIYAVITGGDTPPMPGKQARGLKEQTKLLGAEDKFRVRFKTSAGPFVVEVHPEWAPAGATQFHDLVDAHFYDDCAFFRVLPDFVVQFGINGDPIIHKDWSQPIPDDVPKQSNKKGTVTFATAGPNTRTTQLFINLADNADLDSKGFTPFGVVVEGMENVEKINSEYREQPDQSRIEQEGNPYLHRDFPRLDYIESAEFIE